MFNCIIRNNKLYIGNIPRTLDYLKKYREKKDEKPAISETKETVTVYGKHISSITRNKYWKFP